MKIIKIHKDVNKTHVLLNMINNKLERIIQNN